MKRGIVAVLAPLVFATALAQAQNEIKVVVEAGWP